MENKNIKVIIGLGLVILLTIIALIFIFRKPKPTPQPTTQPQERTSFPVSQQIETSSVRNFTGKITSAKVGKIEGTSIEGEPFSLNIGPKKANFIKQILQEDGSFLIESIGLFDIPLNQEVEIQYDRQDNTVMLVVVKE